MMACYRAQQNQWEDNNFKNLSAFSSGGHKMRTAKHTMKVQNNLENKMKINTQEKEALYRYLFIFKTTLKGIIILVV